MGLNWLDKHEKLSTRMADTVGVDLEEALMRGDIDPAGLREIVLRCAACKSPDGCETWMDRHAEGASHPPDYCRNIDLLERLRP